MSIYFLLYLLVSLKISTYLTRDITCIALLQVLGNVFIQMWSGASIRKGWFLSISKNLFEKNKFHFNVLFLEASTHILDMI